MKPFAIQIWNFQKNGSASIQNKQLIKPHKHGMIPVMKNELCNSL